MKKNIINSILNILFVLLAKNSLSLNTHITQSDSHLLSFIIPCYNCALTISQAIDSIYEQKNLSIPFEIICTDDGSTDNTRLILLDYQSTYSNFHVYFHDQNKGGGATRNACISRSRGNLIFVLDSDNVLVPNSVEGLLQLLLTSGCQAATFEEVRFFQKNFEYLHSWFYQAQDNLIDIRYVMSQVKNPAQDGNYLYTKNVFEYVKGYPEDSRAMDSWGFGLRVLAHGYKIAVLPNTFYWHRVHKNSYSMREMKGNRNNCSQPCWKLAQEFLEIFTPETYGHIISSSPHSDFFKDINFNKINLVSQQALEHIFLAYHYEKNGEFDTAKSEYQKAFEKGAANEKIKKKI